MGTDSPEISSPAAIATEAPNPPAEQPQPTEHGGGLMKGIENAVSGAWNAVTGHKPEVPAPGENGAIPTGTDAPVVPDALGGTAPSSVDTATTASVDTSGGTITAEAQAAPTTVEAPAPIGLPLETTPAQPEPQSIAAPDPALPKAA